MIKQTVLLFSLLMMATADIAAQTQAACSVRWKIAGMLPATKGQKQSLGFAGPVTGIHHNVLLVAGGANFPDSMPWLGGRKKYYDDGAVFKPGKEGKVVFCKSFKLPFPLAYSANCSAPLGVVAVGGENEQGLSDKAFLLQWDKATKKVHVGKLPDLPFALANAGAVAIGSKIFVAGGERKDQVSYAFLLLDLNNIHSGWKQLPLLPKAVSHAVVVAQSDGKEECIYVIGGRKKNTGSTSDLYASVCRFSFKTNQWTEKKSLPYALSAGTGLAVGPEGILLFGGDRGETFHKTEELIAAINKETDAGKKERLNQQKIQLQSTHPGFSKEVLWYSTAKDEWTTVGSIPFDLPVTTTAVQWGTNVFIPSGEIKAGVRTPQILFGKITCNETHRKNKM